MVKTRLTARGLAASAAVRRGVALIDAIVATIILGVALAVIISLTGQAIGSQSQGERLQVAAMLADEQLNLVLARGPDDYAKKYKTTGQCEAPFTEYGYKLELGSGADGAAYSVKVTISWMSPSQRSESVSVETRMAPRTGDDPDPDRKPTEDLVPERLQ